MRSFGLVAQICMMVAAVGVAFLYTVPAFDKVGIVQSETNEYQTLRTKIENINAQLANHVSQVSAISPTNLDRLSVYMPQTVDEAHVMRDIKIIAESSNVTFNEVSYEGPVKESDNDEESAGASLVESGRHSFAVGVDGRYDQLKDFLSLLEKNEYPLEVFQVEIAPLEGGFLSASINMTTYASEVLVEEDQENEI